MNISGEVTLKWGDGTYLFALKAKQIEELQKICGNGEPVSIFEIARRTISGFPLYRDIPESIRLALIGGGMAPTVAMDKVGLYVLTPLAPNDPSGPLQTAQAVLMAALYGVETLEHDDTGEAEAASGEPSPSTSRP